MTGPAETTSVGFAAFIDDIRLKIGGREAPYASREDAEEALRSVGVPVGDAAIREVER